MLFQSGYSPGTRTVLSSEKDR